MNFSVDDKEIEAFLMSHEHIAEPHLFDVGKVIGEWRVTAFIGRGGSGEVYQAKHRLLDVFVAVKVLFRLEQVAKDRFRREASILAKNDVSAFPRFYGYGEVDGYPYLVTELLESLSLPSKDAEIARYLIDVCEGVRRLHDLGYVHRDIKPQNILRRFSTGEPVLIDLGLVKDIHTPIIHLGESLSIVDGKAVGVGTLRYSAPEQFSGGEISPSSDIHALGMLANECFEGSPSSFWEPIIRRSTSSIPAQRYCTVDAFVRAVRCRFVRAYLMLGFALALIVAAVALVFLWPRIVSLHGTWIGRLGIHGSQVCTAESVGVEELAEPNDSKSCSREITRCGGQELEKPPLFGQDKSAIDLGQHSENPPISSGFMKLEWSQGGSYSGDTIVDRDHW